LNWPISRVTDWVGSREGQRRWPTTTIETCFFFFSDEEKILEDGIASCKQRGIAIFFYMWKMNVKSGGDRLVSAFGLLGLNYERNSFHGILLCMWSICHEDTCHWRGLTWPPAPHECTLSVIAYYTQPSLMYYTSPGVRILHPWQNKWTRVLLVQSYIDRGFVFSYPSVF
jgi:hypothetical protein